MQRHPLTSVGWKNHLCRASIKLPVTREQKAAEVSYKRNDLQHQLKGHPGSIHQTGSAEQNLRDLPMCGI